MRTNETVRQTWRMQRVHLRLPVDPHRLLLKATSVPLCANHQREIFLINNK